MTKAELTKYFNYLDDLRDSGRTNMWGSSYFLEREMNVRPKLANEVVGVWMKTFSIDCTMEQRVKLAMESFSDK